uniref:Retrotransposon protein, putative, Ty1-copia subclass n=1 Tax=Oryza sativa subsp. japonica TaxID=39947 RepID=Q2QYH4_ORYSJ|nr:retrotransposon protein, putative, Ty1-copia subclass [Oryza sativa Japonica Group]
MLAVHGGGTTGCGEEDQHSDAVGRGKEDQGGGAAGRGQFRCLSHATSNPHPRLHTLDILPPSPAASGPRRPNGSPPAFASAEFPGSIPDSAQMPPRRRRRRSVAGIDQDDLLDPDALADPDSSFYEINGVRVHHKVCTHEDSSDQSPDSGITNADQNQIGLPIVLLHGFGSSVFSWTHIMRPLARIAGAKGGCPPSHSRLCRRSQPRVVPAEQPVFPPPRSNDAFNLVYICNAMIYLWNKLNHYVLIISTIQKPYYRHCDFTMAGFADALRPDKFTGVHFKRWQIRVTLWLTAMKCFWVSTGKPEGILTTDQQKQFEEATTLFVGCILSVLGDRLVEVYMYMTDAKELWDALNTKFGATDASNDPLYGCQTPRESIFDPFAPGPEELACAPKKKVIKAPELPSRRQLRFDSDDYPVKRLSFEFDEAEEDDQFLEQICKMFIDLIISNQALETTGKDLIGSNSPGSCEPLLIGIADTCPDAPLRRPLKAVQLSPSICRKLDFDSVSPSGAVKIVIDNVKCCLLDATAEFSVSVGTWQLKAVGMLLRKKMGSEV